MRPLPASLAVIFGGFTRFRGPCWLRFLVLLGVVAWARGSAWSNPPPAAETGGVQIFVPLTIDYVTLTAALKKQIYNAADSRAILWRGDNACEFLYARNPRLTQNAPTAVTLESEGELGLGVPLGDQCVNAVSWDGIVAMDLTPVFTPALTLIFHVTDVNLYDRQHRKSLIVGRGFDLIKGNFIPRIESFKFDLRPPIEEFRTLAEEAAPPEQAERFKQVLATVRGAGPAVATPEGIKLTLALTAPPIAAPAPAAPSGPLTPAEQAAWNRKLDEWDAFVVFAIKQVGAAVPDRQVRADLLNVLLNGRYRLAEAIDQPPAPGAADPVRVLFVDQWRQLRDVIRRAAASGQLGDHALEFLSFISAGDALMAFDEAAPVLGVRISAADLRRLARIMAPQSTVDPLQFNYQADPELQHMFGFTPPPQTPDSVEPSDTDAGEPIATPSVPAPSPTAQAPNTPVARSSATTAPPGGVPPAPPMSIAPAPSTPAPTASPTGPSAGVPGAALLLDLLAPRDALAEAPPQPAALKQLGVRLRRAVVNEDNVDGYTRDVSALLDAAAASEIADEQPDPALHDEYRMIVRAAAWQESCWRQFVIAGGRIRYLESSSHDIGLMQVNRYVWRGFYDIRHIEWDIAYNAGAGSQILARLMARAAAAHAARGEALARSVYAGYNGGPGALNRWRSAKEPKSLRLIDQAFWQKFDALRQGQTLNILKCAAEWGNSPGH